MLSRIINIMGACGIGFTLSGALGGSLLIASIGATLTVCCGLAVAILNV